MPTIPTPLKQIELKRLFADLKDKELIDLINEFRNNTPFIGALFSNLIRKYREITDDSSAIDIILVRYYALEEAAFRWTPKNNT